MTPIMRKIAAIVTAVMLSTYGGQAFAAYTLSQLETIEQLIASGEWALLYAYLAENPELLEQSDPLSQELKAFYDHVVETGTISNVEPPEVIPDIAVIEAEIDSY